MSREKWERKEVTGWLDLKMTSNGRCSKLLIEQLTKAVVAGSLHVHSIYDAIGELETGLERSTKRAKPLTGETLKGLWHKHFFQPQFILKNAMLGVEKLSEYDLATMAAPDNVPPEKRIGYLVHSLILAGLNKRTRKSNNEKPKLTGEWIVFAKTMKGNCYLTLGAHGEDEAIAERLRGMMMEFPDAEVLARFI